MSLNFISTIWYKVVLRNICSSVRSTNSWLYFRHFNQFLLFFFCFFFLFFFYFLDCWCETRKVLVSLCDGLRLHFGFCISRMSQLLIILHVNGTGNTVLLTYSHQIDHLPRLWKVILWQIVKNGRKKQAVAVVNRLRICGGWSCHAEFAYAWIFISRVVRIKKHSCNYTPCSKVHFKSEWVHLERKQIWHSVLFPSFVMLDSLWKEFASRWTNSFL